MLHCPYRPCLQPPVATFEDPTVLCGLCFPSRYQSGVILTNKRIVALETRGVVGDSEQSSDYQQTTYFVEVRAESCGSVPFWLGPTCVSMP